MENGGETSEKCRLIGILRAFPEYRTCWKLVEKSDGYDREDVEETAFFVEKTKKYVKKRKSPNFVENRSPKISSVLWKSSRIRALERGKTGGSVYKNFEFSTGTAGRIRSDSVEFRACRKSL